MELMEDDQSASVVVMTTGLSRDDKEHVTQCLKTLSWTEADDFTSQGMPYS